MLCYVAFNHYDKERVTKIGPDAAAAEWLLKNEGSIRGRGFSAWVEDYGGVSVCYTPSFKIAEIKAVDADITSGGCEHFKGLDHLKSVTLTGCVNIGDHGLQLICRHCHKTVETIDITGTGISTSGLKHLFACSNLKSLTHDQRLCYSNGQLYSETLEKLRELNKELKVVVL